MQEHSIQTPKVDVDIKRPSFDVSDIDINSADVKGGIKGFFKGIGGKIKAPEVDLSAANINETKQKTPKVDLSGVDVDLHGPSIKSPKVDVDLHAPKIKTPKVDVDLERTQIKTPKVDVELHEPTVDVSDIDINSADVKGGLKGFFKGIGGKIIK